MRQTRERELKLEPSPGFVLPELGAGKKGRRAFSSTYHDTGDLRVARAGITLRRRVENGRSLWQLKLPGDGSRNELEAPGGPRLPAKLRDLLAAVVGRRELAPVATLRTRRSWSRVEEDGALAEVALDAVSVMDGRRVASRFEEIEVELLRGDDALLERIGKRLRRSGAGETDGRPKVFRALGIDAGDGAVLSGDAEPVEQLKAMLARQLTSMLRHDPGTRLGGDPEDLHQLRVASRRARALLRAARSLLDPAWAKSLRDELSWLGSVLGEVRDRDVLLEHLRAEVATLEGEDGFAAQRIVQALEAEHAEARAAMLEALEGERYHRLLDTLEEAARVPRTQPADADLTEIAAKEFRKLRKSARVLTPDASDEALHDVRIKAKRARYAAELAEASSGRTASRFIARAKRFQDVVGEHQDAVVAEERIRALLGALRGTRVAFAGGLLVERQRNRREAARAALPRAWKKLERSGARAWS